MSAPMPPECWTTMHVNASNREVATRWMWRGTLPLIWRYFSFAVSFDGETIRIRHARCER